jgi:hypothetical protein
MASYSLLLVLLDKDALPDIPYSLDVSAFALLVLPAIALGLVFPYLFVGKRRLWWCWALSASLLAYAVIFWRQYPSSHSTLPEYALKLSAHYLPMIMVGLVATGWLQLLRSRHATNGV